jgi:DNA-binding beta-propeller fold protein YncE
MKRTIYFAAAVVALLFPPAACLAAEFLFAVTTDYETSGQCATIGIENPWPVVTNLEPVSSDPIVRVWRNRIYVVNRLYADNIQVIDPESGFETILEFSVGAGSNPQDIAFVSETKAYVSRYESTRLYEVNPSTGAITDSIDLSTFADADGLPEMSRMVLFGKRLFVQIQKIDRSTWTPLFPAYLAVVDTETNTLVDANPSVPGVQGIALLASNPNGPMLLDESAGKIYVGETGSYFVPDGGIEKIDAISLASDGWVVAESALGGDLGVFALSGDKGYAAVSSDWFYTTRLVSFRTSDGALIGTHYTTDGYVPDIEWDTETAQIFLADRKLTQPGVHVFDAATGARLTMSPRNTGLPPADLAVYRTIIAAIDRTAESEAMRSGRAAWAEPSPFRERTSLHFAAPGQETSEAVVYDLRGRLVRTLRRSERGTSNQLLFEWDGRDDAGREMPAGVYFYRALGGEGAGRVLHVR